MKLYNTQAKKKEEFKPLKGNKVGMYVCGPTVYNDPTLGNLRTFINADFLRRSLIYLGYRVNEVMNITDIEDKIVGKAKDDKVSFEKITQKYEKVFLKDLVDLNIETPEKMPRATDEIPGMIKIIEKLLADSYAYKSKDGSVYFDLAKFKNYGKLSGLATREIKVGARVDVDEYDKEDARDFVLWKAAKEGEPSWEAPFGAGRPGWHIECTAMSTRYLGDTVDIHVGGVDLIFPHHENEIAQSESYTGKEFVRYWFHPEHLLIDGKRMGKPLGNFYTLDNLRDKFKVAPLAFRLLCASAHYRDKLNLTEESLKAADATLKNLYVDVLRAKTAEGVGNSRITKRVKEAEKEFRTAVADDLSIPKALSALFSFLNEANRATRGKYNKKEGQEVVRLVAEFDQVLGLGFSDVKVDQIPEKVLALAKERNTARGDKDYEKSDCLRAEIEKLGFLVEDTDDGTVLRKI